jgi:hypothetical protein
VYGESLLLLSKLIQELNCIVFLPRDRVVHLFNEIENTATNLSIHLNGNQNNFKTHKASNLLAKNDPTLKLIERVHRRKKASEEIIKETFTIQKYITTIYELNKKSDEILKYFFV